MTASESDAGLWDPALRLAAAALSQRRAAGIPFTDSQKRNLEHSLEPARQKLDSGAAARAWMEGSEMSLEQAIQYASQ